MFAQAVKIVVLGAETDKNCWKIVLGGLHSTVRIASVDRAIFNPWAKHFFMVIEGGRRDFFSKNY